MSRGDAVALAIAVAAALAGAALHGEVPISDSAVFEYGGRAIVRGERLYRDVWDNKLPGVFLVDALWQRLFGPQYRLHALAEGAVTLASSLLLGALLRAAERPRAIAVALCAILLALLPASLNTSEAYALVPILGAALAAFRGRNILAGIFVALAAVCWVPALLMLVPLAVAIPSVNRPRLLAASAVTLAAVAAAFVVVLGSHETAALLKSWVAYLHEPAGGEHHRYAALAPLINLTTGLLRSGAAIALALLAALVRPPRDSAHRFGLVWSASMLAGTCVGIRFFEHYFIPAIPALLFTAAAYRWEIGERWRFAFVALALVAAIPAARETAGNDRYRWARSEHNERVAAAIVRALPGSRTIAVVDGYEPTLYLRADPMLRSRYEIVASANERFVSETATHVAPAEVTVEVEPTAPPPSGRPVCNRTAAPWRMFANPAVAPRFAACP